MRVCLIEHFAAATAALISRATGGRRYGRATDKWQLVCAAEFNARETFAGATMAMNPMI
jgi:hypothetical protein